MAVSAPAGLPGSSTDLSTRAAPSHPEEPDDCFCPLLHRRFQASSFFGRLATPTSCHEAETGSLALRLACSPCKASPVELLPLTLARLLVERAIYKISSFQNIRSARLILALRRASSREETHHMNPNRNMRVFSSPSKIPYGGFSPVRLQTGIQPRPSSTMLSLSVRPTYPQTPWIYTRLKSLSQKRAFLRNGTFVQAELPLSYRNNPAQRSLAPQRVMLSRQIIAYYDLIRASLLLPPVYVLSSGSLPVSLLRAGDEKVPNLSRLSFPIVPSSVPRRLGDCLRLLLHRQLWPSPSSHKVGARISTLGRFLRGSCNEAAKFALRYGPLELLALLRQGRLLSSFHLLGHPSGVSSITTRANNQFPRPDLHRLDKQPYRLQAKGTKGQIIRLNPSCASW